MMVWVAGDPGVEGRRYLLPETEVKHTVSLTRRKKFWPL